MDAAAIVGDAGVNTNVGKGALFLLISGIGITGTVTIAWEELGYDDLGFTDFPTNDTDFIIPDIDPPIQRVRLFAQQSWGTGGGAFVGTTRFEKNDSQLLMEPRVSVSGDGGSNTFLRQHMSSWSVPVVPGDFFHMDAFHSDTGNQRQLAEWTYFEIVVVR